MNDTKDKVLFRASEEKVTSVSKRKDSSRNPEKKNVFRLDSAAYFKAKNEHKYNKPKSRPDLKDNAAQSTTVAETAGYRTTQIPFPGVVEGIQDRYAKAKSAVENLPYDLGGRMTQTIEISLIDSETVRAADTKFGVFVEIEEAMEPREIEAARYNTGAVAIPGQRPEDDVPDDLISPEMASYLTVEMPLSEIAEGMQERFEKAKSAAQNQPRLPGGHMTQTIELSLIDSETVRAADTNIGVFVEIEESMDVARDDMEASGEDKKPGTETQDGGIVTQFGLDIDELNSKIYKNETAPWTKDGDAAKKPFIKRLFPPRIVAFLVAAAMLFSPLALFSTVFRIVRVYVGGEQVFAFATNETDPGDMLIDGGYDLRPADQYEIEYYGGMYNINLERSAKIVVMCDGGFIEHYVLNKTAGEALDELGITLGEDDETSIPLATLLEENDLIEVFRITYEFFDKTETVEWQSVEKYSPLIGEGNRQEMNPGGGQNGEAIRTYRERYVNGALAETTLEKEVYTVFPVDEVTLIGDPDAIMSTVDGSKYTDIKIVDNKPEEYFDVLEKGICTAYSFSPGTFGASGMYLIQGFVAVNTDVIPYGTLLYITSSDGSFVYGWAVAADIGTAMMEGRVDIDCFFETYRESALFGKKTLNVYMVKQLTQSDLEEYAANWGMFNSRIPE